MATGCARDRPEPSAEPSEADRLNGVWEAELSVTTPLISQRDTSRRAVGELALITDDLMRHSGREGWSPTHVGVHSIDFRELGFDPRVGGRVPGIVAVWQPPDSLKMYVDPVRSGEHIRFAGRLVGDSVVGEWHFSFPQGGARGRFVLRR